jgi:hypothetical protein
MRSATSASSPRWNARASSRPPAAPTSASSTLSLSIWRISRPRRAPRAERTPISCSRTALRARSRFATFTQAMSSTSATAPASTGSAGRIWSTICSWMGTSVTDQPALRAGTSCASAAAMVRMSLDACSSVTPAFSRASPNDEPRPGAARSCSTVLPKGIRYAAVCPISVTLA